MTMQIDHVFYLIVLIVSIVIHEVAHGWAALYYGDTTARDMGRLSLNPIKHIDPIGSILVPVMLLLTGSPYMVGWARPVPYNPNNLNDKKNGTRVVALAGIVANLIIAGVFVIILRIGLTHGMSVPILQFFALIILVNLVLAFFNLLPIPPLDGSKILASFSGPKLREFIETRSMNNAIIFLILAIAIWHFVSPYVFYLYAFLIS